jgi:type IV pilus assembly protein PilV
MLSGRTIRAASPTLPRHSRGVSLIEVLIAIVVASIGLLALAGVNTAAIRYTKMSQYRSTATLLANDIGERIRANKSAVVAGVSAYTVGADFATQATLPVAPAKMCDNYGGGAACTAAEVATADLYTWRRSVRDQLPSGSVYIGYQNLQSAYDVWLVWRDPAVASDDVVSTGSECPAGLTVAADPSIRCSYFRINV